MRIFLLLCAAIFSLTGCSLLPEQAPPSADQLSRFLEHREELRPHRERAPFLVIWVEESNVLDDAFKRHDKIAILPVNLSYLEVKEGEPDPDDVQEVAEYLRTRFREELYEKEGSQFHIVDVPGPNTFVIELALIKLESTVVAANVAKDVAGFFIPGSMAVSSAISMSGGAMVKQLSKGKIGIAMKFREAITRRVLGEFYDERSDRSALLMNTGDYSRFGNAKINIDDWAEGFAELVTTPPSNRVEGPSEIALVLW